MKKLLLAILLLASLNSFAQYNPYKHERGENIDTWMAIGVITTSVVLGGIDDGLDSTTNWGDASTVPVVVTKQQTAPWDIGAYVH